MEKVLTVGVMGGAAVDKVIWDDAYELGMHIAKKGWVLLNGGRNKGVMEASAKGAFDCGGITIGILPGENKNEASPYVKIPIVTAMGSARNMINVLSCDIVVALMGGAGTISEIALALKHKKIVLLLKMDLGTLFKDYEEKGMLLSVETPRIVIDNIVSLLKDGRIGGPK